MAGVGDQVALGLERARERVERGVEAGGEPRELVASARRQALGEVQGAGELLGAAGEAGDGGERGACHQRPQKRREGDPGEAHDQQDQQDVAELVVDLGEGQRDQHRPAGPDAEREHPQVRPPDGAIGERLAAATRGDLPLEGARRDRGRGALAAGHVHGAGGGDELHIARGPPEARGRDDAGPPIPRRAGRRSLAEGAPGPSGGAGGGHRQEPLGALAQRGVDLPAQVGAHREVDRDRREQHGDGDGEARGGGDAGAQGHGSRRT